MGLVQEAIAILKEHGKSPDDVRWVGSEDGAFAVDWDAFNRMPDRYERGFGAQKVALDLVIVGDDWWMERHEYDGSEWWEFKTRPKRQPDAAAFKRVIVAAEVGWVSIQAMANRDLRNANAETR